MDTKKVTPITRVNKFFSAEDMDLEVEMGREAIEGDGNFTVILYRVNQQMTESDNIYGEGTKDGIRFHPPVELKVIPIMGESENKSYNDNGTGRVLDDGQFIFGIYDAQLVELKTSISFGDYIGYPISETEIRYFSVADDGVKNFDNKHTIMGFRSAFRTIKCAPIDATEFRGL
jgi:hypothetical protein